MSVNHAACTRAATPDEMMAKPESRAEVLSLFLLLPIFRELKRSGAAQVTHLRPARMHVPPHTSRACDMSDDFATCDGYVTCKHMHMHM